MGALRRSTHFPPTRGNNMKNSIKSNNNSFSSSQQHASPSSVTAKVIVPSDLPQAFVSLCRINNDPPPQPMEISNDLNPNLPISGPQIPAPVGNASDNILPRGTHRKQWEIRLVQANMQHCINATSELYALFKSKHLDFLLLQEPYAIKPGPLNSRTTPWETPGFGLQTQIACVRSERPGAAIVLCNPAYKMLFIPQLSSSHCAVAQILTPETSFYVVSHYFQPKISLEEHLTHLEKALLALHGEQVLVGLDANARSMLWGSGETNRRGEKLEKLIKSLQLNVENTPGEPSTYYSTRGESNIDVTLTTKVTKIVKEWRVRPDWIPSSDHRAIDIRLRDETLINAVEAAGPLRFNIKKADWETFESQIKARTKSELSTMKLESSQDVESMAESLGKIIITSCEKSMRRKKRFRKSNPWWTRELTKAKKGMHRARKSWQDSKRTVDANRATTKRLSKKAMEARKNYKRELEAAKRKSWQDYVTTEGNDQPWGLAYKLKAGKLKIEKVLSALREGNNYTCSLTETASRLLRVHSPLDDPSTDSAEQRETRSRARIPPDTEDADLITTSEVIEMTKTFDNNTAPGSDQIEVGVLKKALSTILEDVTRLFNGCLKYGVFPAVWKEGSIRILLKSGDKDVSDPKSYRPICLLSVFGKLLEKLIKTRITRTVMSEGNVSDRQFGFTENKSTEDAIREMRNLVEDTREKYAIAILFDIAGAFDNVWWPLVLEGLKERGCPCNVFNVISSYLDNRTVKISWGWEEVKKQATRGCPQGSVLGPTLWNIMFDGLLQRLEREQGQNFVAYADDLLIVIRGNSRKELEINGQRAVEIVVDWCSAAKLQLSSAKTEAIIMRNKFSANKRTQSFSAKRRDRMAKTPKKNLLTSRPPVIRIGNSTVKFKKTVRYLGVHFDREMRMTSHCKIRCQQALKLMQKLGQMSREDWGLRFKTLQLIYKGAFLPIILYGAGVWSDLIKTHDMRKLVAAHRQALIATTAAYRTASYESLCVVAGTPPIDLLLDERRARYDLRIGKDTKLGDREFLATDVDAVKKVKTETINRWQARWAENMHGQDTSAFFANVEDRLKATWVQPSHYVTQILTGHGNFGANLARRGLRDCGDCVVCGVPDTPAHFLLECVDFEPQREIIREACGGLEWKEAAEELVKSESAFKILVSYTREALWLKSFLDLNE